MIPILKKQGRMPRSLKQLTAAEAYQKLGFIISAIIAVFAGILVSISQTATTFYLSSLSFILSILSFIAFLICLFLFFNARKQTPVRDPALSVKFQGSAFRYWFIAHSLIWIFILNAILSIIYMILPPSPLLVIILAGIVAVVVLTIAGAFLLPTLHTSQMLGLCWKSPIPENIIKKPLVYASATVFLSQRYEQAALYDQKQSIPLLWSISRAFEPSPVGSVTRKLELIPSAFNLKMILKEIRHRFNVLIPLFVITTLLSAIPFILGINPISPDSVPRDWPIFSHNTDTLQSQLKPPPQNINKPSNPDNPNNIENPKNSENLNSSQQDQRINKDDIEKNEEDTNSNTENSSQLPPGNQNDEIGIDKNSSNRMNTNTDTNTNLGTDNKTGKETQNSLDSQNSKDQNYIQKNKNSDQTDKQISPEQKKDQKRTDNKSEKETSNSPNSQNKNNQNQAPKNENADQKGEQKGAGQKKGEQTGAKDKGNQGQSGQSQKSGNSQSQQPDQKGPGQSQGEGSQQDSNQNGQASGAGQDSQQGKNSTIPKVQQGNGQDGGGSGGTGQGMGSPDDKPKMSDEPEPLAPLPSRSSPVVSIELPTLDPSGKAGKNPYKEQKDKSSQLPKSKAPTSKYSTEKQNPSISKPDQFLPNWIRIILLLK